MSRFFGLEKRFTRDSLLAEKYKETVNQNIKKGQTTKLTIVTASQTSGITNYIPHQLYATGFSVLSNFHPSRIEISDGWVVNDLNLPFYKMAKDFSHLRDIDLERTSDKGISILIGADMPELHLHRDTRIGDKDQPIGLLTAVGWMLMVGKSKTNLSDSNPSFYFLNRYPEVLDKSIERFRQTESYVVLKRDDPNLMPNADRRAINILNPTRFTLERG